MSIPEIDQAISRDVSRAARVIAECRLIAGMSEEAGKITRRFLTPAMAQVHTHLTNRMQELGMTVKVDAVGNLRGRWTPPNAKSEWLILGSHIDSVPDAGAFDGVLGVVLALEWVRVAQKIKFNRPIEVIAFSEEEGVRYGVPFLGSRAVTGTFDFSLLPGNDSAGLSMREAISQFGLDPEKIAEAALNESVAAFIEIHIEQGPVLDSVGLPIAAVDGIVGQTRINFYFEGQPNHAGTTPMDLRQDALAAAAEWIGSVESVGRETSGLVATVGKLIVAPNASNVIPGKVEATLDVRHLRNEVREHCAGRLIESAKSIAESRGCTVQWVRKMNSSAVEMDLELTAKLAAAVEQAGFPVIKISSGAGHDAMIMAAQFPTAMLFLRSPGGISHHPAETVLATDVEAAIQVAEYLLPVV